MSRIAEDAAWVMLKPFGNNAIEGVEVGGRVEDHGLRIATIQCVVDSIRFIGSFGSWHVPTLPDLASRRIHSWHLCCPRECFEGNTITSVATMPLIFSPSRCGRKKLPFSYNSIL